MAGKAVKESALPIEGYLEGSFTKVPNVNGQILNKYFDAEGVYNITYMYSYSHCDRQVAGGDGVVRTDLSSCEERSGTATKKFYPLSLGGAIIRSTDFAPEHVITRYLIKAVP